MSRTLTPTRRARPTAPKRQPASEAPLQIIFEWHKGKLLPRLPRGRGGIPRRVDGKRLLSLRQAAKRSGDSIAFLFERYFSVWQDSLLPGDAKTLQEYALSS